MGWSRAGIASDLRFGTGDLAIAFFFWCAVAGMVAGTIWIVLVGLRHAAASGWLEPLGLYGPPL